MGLSKTGTKTMNAALARLGYKNYDFDYAAYYLYDDWRKIINEGGTKEDFYRMYKDVDACTDLPACHFWPELLEAFPDAKLVYTVREEESWVKSAIKQAAEINANIPLIVLGFFSPTARAFCRFLNDCTRGLYGLPTSMTFIGPVSGLSSSILRKVYREHKANVMMNAPKDRMITYSVKEGWEPLCKFLGTPIPDIPFPHKNPGGSVIDEFMVESPMFQQMKKEAPMYLALYIAIIAIVVYLFFW